MVGPSPVTWLGLVYLSHLLHGTHSAGRAAGWKLELGGPSPNASGAGQGLQPSPARKCLQMLPTSARHTRARSAHMTHITRLFCTRSRRHAQRRATKQIVGNLERSGRTGGSSVEVLVLHTFYVAGLSLDLVDQREARGLPFSLVLDSPARLVSVCLVWVS